MPVSAQVRKTETVTADARAGMNDTPGTDFRVLTDHDIGVEDGIGANTATRADVHARVQHGAVPDDSPGINVYKGTYRDICSEENPWRDTGAGVDTRRGAGRRRRQLIQRHQEGHIRIFHTDRYHRGVGNRGGYEGGGCFG
ncbi:MAG: hypothetical protein BWX80_03349 [Candidatus Hydrogenedentes bacterium ADurb.Bin101]|nr:MAG: hypothetical protein BWX80_03349 [Candidatus Hydrogenedentes bacterium ADurb.Bin101]